MPTSTPDPHDEAKRFIDRIIAVNKQFGATHDVPDDEYVEAVEHAAELFDPASRSRMQAESYAEDNELGAL
jgi:hypothetical protein